jgi:hypothetical protein
MGVRVLSLRRHGGSGAIADDTALLPGDTLVLSAARAPGPGRGKAAAG